jgi:polyferredoxin
MKKPKSRWRLAVQIVFFVLVAAISANNALKIAGVSIPVLSSASLHAICPFGGVVSIYQVVTAGIYVQKVHSASFILMIIAFLVALLFGPVFCGWLCPMGSIQEWFGKLGKKILGRRYNRLIPAKVDRVLRYLRYAVLAWVLYMTAVTGKLIFADYDPYFALFNLWSSEIAIGGIIALAVTLALSLVIERPFCKYACPYGAALGIFNLFRIFAVRRNPPTCTNCKACDRACPMNIQVSTKPGRVRDHQCISCLECTSEKACPEMDTVIFGIGAPAAPAAAEPVPAKGATT